MKKIIIKTITLLILITISVLLYAKFIENRSLTIKEYKIIDQNFTDNFYGLKIVHISDILYGSINKKQLDKIVKKVNKLSPDIIIITGNYYYNGITDEKIKDLNIALTQMNAKINKYTISGDLDEKENYEKIINNTGFINLNDNYDIIYNTNFKKILFTGLNTENDIEPILNQINQKIIEDKKDQDINYKILLIHKPDSIQNIDYSQYNLILAGHSLNGHINLPLIGPIIKLNGAKKYNKPFYKLDNTQLFISNGIGTLNNNLRLFNKPSINLYRLTNK